MEPRNRIIVPIVLLGLLQAFAASWNPGEADSYLVNNKVPQEDLGATEEGSRESRWYSNMIAPLQQFQKLRLPSFPKLRSLPSLQRWKKLKSVEKFKGLPIIQKLTSLPSVQKLQTLADANKLSNMSTSYLRNLRNFQSLPSLRNITSMQNLTTLVNLQSIASLSTFQNLSSLQNMSNSQILEILQNITGIENLLSFQNYSDLAQLRNIPNILNITSYFIPISSKNVYISPEEAKCLRQFCHFLSNFKDKKTFFKRFYQRTEEIEPPTWLAMNLKELFLCISNIAIG